MDIFNTRVFRADIIETMNVALEKLSLYDGGTFEESMALAMERITAAVKVDFMALFRHLPNAGEMQPYQILRWDGKRGRFIDRDIGFAYDLPFARQWGDMLNKNICICLRFSEADENEQDFMFQYGVKSLLIVPVFIRGEIWGEIVFQDNEEERTFEDDIINLLRSISMILINAYIRAETERKLTDESFFNRKLANDLLRREKMLNALNQTAMRFLSQHERVFGGQIYAGMEMMAGYADVDRVCVWKREVAYNTRRYTLYRKWSNSGNVNPVTIDEGGIFPFESFSGWDSIFFENGYIHCVTSELQRSKKAIMENYGTCTLLVFPVFSQEGLWGLVSFDNCVEERLFKADEVDTLRYASLMLGSVIVRDEEVGRVREAEARIKLMLDATPLSCQLWDRNFNFIDCNEAAYKLFDLTSKEELEEKFSQLVPETQPDGRESTALSRENLIKAFSEGGTVFEWMYRLPDGSPLPTEVTLKRVEYKGGYIVAGYTRDLRKLKLLESEAGKIYFDPLTGIYNRRFLDEHLTRIVKTLSRSAGKLSLMIVDIDRFKEYNDTYGHIEGDDCLRMIAETLKNGITRTDDFVARYGGEEFAVVLPNTDEHGARMIADRLINSIRQRRYPHMGSDVHEYVTISMGITTGRVSPLHIEQDFLGSADSMVYKAKREGRNRYCFQKLI